MNTSNPPDGPGIWNAALNAILEAKPKLPTPERDFCGRPWKRGAAIQDEKQQTPPPPRLR